MIVALDSLWAWAIQRLLDAAERLGGLDMGQVAVAGHSRLGKAALWAAATDTRISAVLANNSGCAGAAPAGHAVRETLARMAATFPHWIWPQVWATSLDQHHLIACTAPRKVCVASAEHDLWADPAGTYLALVAASRVWPAANAWPEIEDMRAVERQTCHAALGLHLRPGGHEMLPYDWQRFLDFLAGGHACPLRPWVSLLMSFTYRSMVFASRSPQQTHTMTHAGPCGNWRMLSKPRRVPDRTAPPAAAFAKCS